ncbi:enoyl-CoA hydratase-related protein [Xanthobacter sp. 126]|uniref:enoyl-CoA hydratase/isomerase family protein n=1 Tax=Xanthobacter sp. 126 TaxID=1131814 RepID=UPI00045EC369|nr:enoyl-CoA hydratase-related protein [Xanthobacter sp. 126]
MPYKTIELSVAGPVTTLRMNRPDVMNAMDAALLEDMLEATEATVADPDCRVIVVTGAGRAFCSGGDISTGLETVNGEGTLDQQAARLRRFMRISELLYTTDKVTVAAINGACAGAGLSVACACDFRLAADNAKFATAFQNVGVSGDFGISWLLPRIVGPAPARQLMLDPKTLNAEQAHAIGLVGEVHPASELTDAVEALVGRLLSRTTLSLGYGKLNLAETFDLSFADHMDREARRHAECCRSTEAKCAASAFFERRAPKPAGA